MRLLIDVGRLRLLEDLYGDLPCLRLEGALGVRVAVVDELCARSVFRSTGMPFSFGLIII
jgi:hypothetical protein